MAFVFGLCFFKRKQKHTQAKPNGNVVGCDDVTAVACQA